MELYVELPDGTNKLVPVSLNCSVRAATQSSVLRAGMSPVASKLSEFSLAKKINTSNPLVDVCWLDEGVRLREQGGDTGSMQLILLKKYFSSNSDLGVVGSSSVLLKNIYSQFRRAYVNGLYRCTQSEAVQLSALIARAEFSLSELRPGSLQKTGRLERILPPLYLKTPAIERNILTALNSVAKLTESQAQEQFIDLIRKSDTFGLSMHTITLVQSGGEMREALLGVGPQHIAVMVMQNLQVLMQWSISNLTGFSFDESTFTMTYGTESVTVVTKHGHMISAFLSGMGVLSPSNGVLPGNKKPVKPPKPAVIPENGHVDRDGMSERTTSTHIKSVGKQVEQFEVKLQKSRPIAAPRLPPGRPAQPPKRKQHAALRGTRSVPIQPVNPQTALASVLQPRGLRNASTKTGSSNGGGVYEVPIQYRKITEGKADKKVSTQLAKWEEAHYETSDLIKEEPSQLVLKDRPLRPPPPQDRKKLLQKKPLPWSINESPEKHFTQNAVHLPLKKMHKSDSDVTAYVSNSMAATPEGPVYDELVPQPDYADPDEHLQKMSRDRGGKNVVLKRKLQLSTSPNVNVPNLFSNPLSPPPPSSPAPPPPSASTERATKTRRESSSHVPPPLTPAPAPPVYETLTVEDDIKEIEDVFGSKDLPMQVKYSCDTNPIYDTLAAIKVKSSLSSSDMTYHSFTSTLEKRKKKQKPSKAVSQPQLSPPASSSFPSSSSPLPSSPHTYENSELLSLLMKDISPSSSPTRVTELGEHLKEEITTPSPQLTKAKFGAHVANGPKVDEPATKPLMNGKPSYGYSRLEHFPGKASAPASSPAPTTGATASDEDTLGHEYAIVDYNTPKSTKVGQKKQNLLKKTGWANGVTTPPPVPPMRVSEGEGRKIAPPKPPRSRLRWEKKAEKGESKAHKAVKNSDALRDYSTLMQEFRIFHVKLPTGVIHTELANVKSEVGKLVKRLCVLLNVDEDDHAHYSLYVEGASFTHLSEMVDEEGGGEETGMFRKLRQKSPSRSDLFSSNNKSFAVLSERSTNPILLDPALSFKSQGISTTRILALRPQTVLPDKLTRFQIRVPDWVRFHQCWLSVVQGNLIATQAEAIKLAALQYQAYFLDRTELNSVIGFCRSSDFLPQDYASVKGIEEKVFAEQQLLKGYTRLHAQDSYIFTACSMPTYSTIFFQCMEAKRKLLRHPKLAPVLIGMSKEGVVRADYKTKEILDVWPYQVLKNWGYTDQTFILEFEDRTYPVKTGQGRWMNALVDFHIESILGDLTTPPVTHQELIEASVDEVVPIPHNRDNVDEIYSDLLSVRLQAQQWLAEANHGKPSSSSSPPSSPPNPHSVPPSQYHATSITSKQPNQMPPPSVSPPLYEEVDFEPVPRTVGFYDVLRKEDTQEEDDAPIYDLPPDS